MQKHMEDKLTMYLGVESVLEANVTKTDTLPALKGALANFKARIAAIEGKSKEFDLAVTGKTQVKLDAEDDLVGELLPAVFAVAAYAHEKGDSELFAKVNTSESGIRKLRDTEIVTKSNGLLELVQSQVANLADYGVTAETVASIRRKIDAYASSIGRKEGGYSERSSARQTLHDLFDETDAILGRQIDTLMEHFRKPELEFYNAYCAARFIRAAGAARKQKPAIAAAGAIPAK